MTFNLFSTTAVSALLIAMPVCTAGAWAQDTDARDATVAKDTGEPEEILVTATRVPTAIGDVAAPVTVLTGDVLLARGIYRVSDALDQVAGITIQKGAAVGGQTQLRLRGAEANQTLILIDGIEANDPAAADEVQLENLLIADIERIEIVRGPQSVAWGSDALAGVINIITKQQTEGVSVTAHTEAGSFGTFRAGGSLGAAGEGWHLRGGVSYVDQTGVNASRTGDEKDGYRNVTANIKGGARLFDRFDLLLTARHTDANAEFDAVDFSTGLPGDSDSTSDTKNTYLSAGISGDIIDGLWRQSLRVTYLDTEIENFALGSPNGSTAGERLGFYADATFTPFDGQAVTFLIDHEENEYRQTGEATAFGDPNQRQEQDVTGYGINYIGDWFTGLTVTGSVRRDDNSFFENITTWRAGASYTPSASGVLAGARFYGSIGRGQKDPTFTELFGFFSDQFIGNPNLQPERSLNIELGWEQTWLDGELTTRVSAFDANLENEINGFVFDPVSFQFTADNIDGDSERRGVEVEINWKASESISVNGSYSYLDASETDSNGIDLAEVRRPDHSAFLGINWTPSEAFSLTVMANYRSEAIDLFFPPFPEPSQRVRLDDYVLVNVNARYQINERFEVFARVENLTDAQYEDVIGFNTPGFGAFGGVRVRF